MATAIDWDTLAEEEIRKPTATDTMAGTASSIDWDTLAEEPISGQPGRQPPPPTADPPESARSRAALTQLGEKQFAALTEDAGVLKKLKMSFFRGTDTFQAAQETGWSVLEGLVNNDFTEVRYANRGRWSRGWSDPRGAIGSQA